MAGGKNKIHEHENAGKGDFRANPQNIGKGRKKKIYTVIKELGYSADDIKTAFGELSFYDTESLANLVKDDSKPVIVRIVARQFLEALKKSDWTKIREILEHVIGKAPASVDLTTGGEKIKQIFKIGDQEIEF
jgi:hypothetical protein